MRDTIEFLELRRDFPILAREVGGRPLVYLDNAASSQMPAQVIERMDRYGRLEHSNVHRGVHTLSQIATAAYEDARSTAAAFLGATDVGATLFTSGATEGLNLVMHGYGRAFIKGGDEILVSAMEHHSNIVPWQMLCQETGARLRVIPMNDRGELILDEYRRLLSSRTRLVAVNHISNALGTINPVKEMAALAHEAGAVIVVDGAQAVPHTAVDVVDLDCDFYAMSGHKVFGPTGIGVLYGKRTHLERMRPFLGGGDMILSVTFDETEYAEIPAKFEAGTPKIEGAVGLAAALNYITEIGMDAIAARERELLDHATAALERVDGLTVIGTAEHKASVLSFTLEGVHPHDIGTILDTEGVAVRTGHHCAQPVMAHFGIPATTRASFAFYNTFEDIDALVRGLHKVREIFG